MKSNLKIYFKKRFRDPSFKQYFLNESRDVD